MERNAKQILTGAAALFDLPQDLLGGLPRVEVIGDSQLLMEHHRGILSYSDEEIDISADGFLLRIFGESLELESMTGEALRLKGRIRRVEWEAGC